jgi:predicted metal-dependent HD superfamily phosphohydrolase
MIDWNDAWHSAWQGVGAQGGGEALRDSLLAAYAEPQRHYHTLQHLGECLHWFSAVRHLAERPAEVELALWFHDAVYDVHRGDNEARSAEWADSSLREAGADGGVADRVAALVMATRHSQPASGDDAQLLVDIDLAILGTEPARFDQYDQQIRAEYAFVPDGIYRAQRREVLQSFLDRPRLYATSPMRAALEAPARTNLRRAIERAAGP